MINLKIKYYIFDNKTITILFYLSRIAFTLYFIHFNMAFKPLPRAPQKNFIFFIINK